MIRRIRFKIAWWLEGADSRSELDDHLLAQHPDLPDPTHDPRWRAGGEDRG